MKPIGDHIRQYFPDIAADRLVALPHPGWGGDSDAWLVDDRWIFRFPRTAEVTARLAIEVCLLPRLAARLPLPIPSFVHVARTMVGEPMFVGYEAIPGGPLHAASLRQLPRIVQDRIAHDLGSFLRALHQTPLDVALACGLTRPSSSARDVVEHRYQTVRELVFPLLGDSERAWISRRFEGFLAEPHHFLFPTVLCHGDFSSDHLLFDVVGERLSGVIDFGDVTIGDPAGDFTWRDEYGEPFFASALRAYAIADPAFAERVAFRIDCLPLIQIGYGVETGQTDEVEQGVLWLRRSIDRSAKPDSR